MLYIEDQILIDCGYDSWIIGVLTLSHVIRLVVLNVLLCSFGGGSLRLCLCLMLTL